jgi:hypothetical protein
VKIASFGAVTQGLIRDSTLSAVAPIKTRILRMRSRPIVGVTVEPCLPSPPPRCRLPGRAGFTKSAQADWPVTGEWRLPLSLRQPTKPRVNILPRYAPVLECTPVSFFPRDGVQKPFK